MQKSTSVVRRGLHAALLAVLGAYGCESRCSCSKGSSKNATDAAAVETPVGDPNIELLDRGKEPKIQLRVARWAGLRYRVELQVDGSVAAVGQPPAPAPRVMMTFEHEVTRGTADPIVLMRDGGAVRLVEERARLERVQMKNDLAPKPFVDEWNKALEAFHGSTMVHRIAENGEIAKLELELIAGARPPPELKQAMDNALDVQRRFPFRLPPVPVGLGARWRFREKIEVNEARAIQIADMALKSFDTDQAVIHIRIRQQAPQQEVPHPFQPDASAMLDQFRGDGDGELVIDRLTGIPLRGRLTTTAHLTLSGDVAGRHESATFIAASVVVHKGTILGEDAGLDQASGDDSSAPLEPAP